MKRHVTRRGLLAFTGTLAMLAKRASAAITGDAWSRREFALKLRVDAAGARAAQIGAPSRSNGDETILPRWSGSFTKGLATTQSGEVEPGVYETLLRALESGKHSDFQSIIRGSGRRLVNPQSAYAFCLEGGDPQAFGCPSAPAFSSAEMAAEMREMYWLSISRDIPFREYTTSEIIQQAAHELNTTPTSVFRAPLPAAVVGPYISQFLARPISTLSTITEQRYRTAAPGQDFMTIFSEWLQIQTGVPPWRECTWDSPQRYVRNGRDLAEYVHYDYLYQPFLNAALILMNYRPESMLFETRSVLSETNPYKHSKLQDGFVTFGLAQVVDWLGRVTTAALKAAWAQKWLVHRRLRPEAFAGRIHQTKTKVIEYPIHSDIFSSTALEETYRQWGSYLLPQAYPEGSPLHPSYPGGHASVAGACSVVLKAMFDENGLMSDCVHASADGLSLEPCPATFVPTIGAEINKLVFNTCMGRSWAGIHYPSDSAAGIRLGEDVGISILQDLVRTCTEDFEGFRFTRVDGTPVKITPDGEVS